MIHKTDSPKSTKPDLEALKTEFLLANREYQFAMAAGEPRRLTKALGEYEKTFNAYNKAKKADFMKRERQAKNAKN